MTDASCYPNRWFARLLGAVGLALLSVALVASSTSCSPKKTIDVSAYCMGDSITYGVGCAPYGEYERRLQTLLNTRPDESWTIYNVGVSGDTTAKMLDRFNADVLSHQDCGYVFVWGGINDVLQGYDVSVTEANLQSMFTRAHAAGIKVVSLNVTPLNHLSTPTRQAAIESINLWIALLATNIDYRIDVHSALEDPENPDHLNPAYTDDGLHLNCAGYDIVAEVVFEGIAHGR